MYSTRSKEGRSVLELKCSFHLTVFMGVRAIPFLSLMPKRFLDLAQDFVLIEGTVPIIFATMHLEMVQDAFLAPHMDPKVTQKETLGENG